MSAKTIGIIQVKGGAGRSTVSTNLAGELSKMGKTVLIDCDMPQGTAASWYSVREQAGKASNLVADTATNHRELVAKVEQYQDADFIVLDGPPRIAELTRAILVLADLCLVPALACDASGIRLGYGGGFYDRYLADREALRLRSIAVGFRCQQVESVPVEETDVKPYQVILV